MINNYKNNNDEEWEDEGDEEYSEGFADSGDESQTSSRPRPLSMFEEEPPLKLGSGDNCQWIVGENNKFIPCGKSQETLTPGVYEVKQNPSVGTYLEKIPERTDTLLRFSQNNSEEIITEIQKFWSSKEKYERYGITQRRGILMFGRQGCGKSSIIRNLMSDVIGTGGVIIRFTNPHLLIEGLRIIRQIQDTPVIVLMEDIDSLLEYWDESEILNILDGVHAISGILFVATTNFPEKLGARIINRPNRFDKRYKIDLPNLESREEFITHISKGDVKDKELTKWVKDTEGFSLAHITELFTSVYLLDTKYDHALKTLKDMSKHISSEDDEHKEKVGFRSGKK